MVIECAARRSYVLEGFSRYDTLYCSFSRSYVAIKYSSELEQTCTIG